MSDDVRRLTPDTDSLARRIPYGTPAGTLCVLGPDGGVQVVPGATHVVTLLHSPHPQPIVWADVVAELKHVRPDVNWTEPMVQGRVLRPAEPAASSTTRAEGWSTAPPTTP